LNNEETTFRGYLHRHTADFIALLLAVVGFVASACVTQRVFEGVPHIEDEIAYVWQAEALADGYLKIPSPPHPRSYLVPFVVDYDGERFGKYPPGWPALLSLAIQLDLRPWLNPLLAGLGVWLTYLLGKRYFSLAVGLLAASLTVTSPFFLLNSGSLLSHPFGLVLSASFTLAWLDGFWIKEQLKEGENPYSNSGKQWWLTIFSALLLGIMILTRPMTALALAIPFAVHGLYLVFRSNRGTRLRLLVFVLIVIIFAGLYFLWQYSLTGNALLNPYTLWWKYDSVGFGPGHGRYPDGHNLSIAWQNLRNSVWAGKHDLFGWGAYSWIFLPFGLWATRRNPRGLLIGSVILSMALVYMAYWIGATLYGPRYYYEGLFSLTLISGAGIAWLAGWPVKPGQAFVRYRDWRKLSPLLVVLVVGVLVGINLKLYTPLRLESMVGLYNIERSDQATFVVPSAQALAPALIIVHSDRWMEYGALLDLQDPELTTPFIFAWSNSPGVDAALAGDFPGRTVYHYYPEQPFKLFQVP